MWRRGRCERIERRKWVRRDGDLADFRAENGADAEKRGDRDEADRALAEFFFDSLEVITQRGEFLLLTGQDFVFAGFKGKGAGVLDLGVVLAVPVNQSSLSDVDLSGDVGQAMALGTELEELVFGFNGVHKLSWELWEL